MTTIKLKRTKLNSKKCDLINGIIRKPNNWKNMVNSANTAQKTQYYHMNMNLPVFHADPK